MEKMKLQSCIILSVFFLFSCSKENQSQNQTQKSASSTTVINSTEIDLSNFANENTDAGSILVLAPIVSGSKENVVSETIKKPLEMAFVRKKITIVNPSEFYSIKEKIKEI